MKDMKGLKGPDGPGDARNGGRWFFCCFIYIKVSHNENGIG